MLAIPRSNMIAVRAVKLMEEQQKLCTNEKHLTVKFVARNNL